MYIYICVYVLIYIYTHTHTHEGCPESMQPFWISREPVAQSWCTLAASQRRPYCTSVNSHSPMGLVSQQWDADDWACVLCDCRIHTDRASITSSSSYQLPYSPDLAPCNFWIFPVLKSPLKGRWFVNATVTQHTSSVSGVSLLTD
jgi:hypothetical protein